MRLHSLFTAALQLAGVAFATTTTTRPNNNVVQHEKRTLIPSTWEWTSRASKDIVLPVRIAIAPRNAELGHDHLMDISDPLSPNFGKHWTPQQVHDYFSPTPQTVAAVREWLHSAGITGRRHKVAGSHGHIQFLATVAEMESLLSAQYDVWKHPETGSLSVSCADYYLPEHIRHHIDFITPTVGIDRPGSSRLKSRALRERAPSKSTTSIADPVFNSESVTPEKIRALYQIPLPTKAFPNNDMGLYEEADAYDQLDFNDFFTRFAPRIPNGTHPILQSVDGGVAPVPPEQGFSESVLDFEVAYPIIYPQQIHLYQVYDRYTVETIAEHTKALYNLFLDALDGSYCSYDGGDDPSIDPKFPDGHGYNKTRQCGVYKPTHVISISYAQAEAFFPPAYETRQCHEFLKLGLQGTSVLFASGDNGTLARAGVVGCLPNGAQNPSYPASCPYVTSVGATQIKYNAMGGEPDGEEAVNPNNMPQQPFSSGGGFSNVFARPEYQASAVSEFLSTSTKLPAKSTYNATGRAFPDISAVGWNIATYFGGKLSTASGTSAATPLVGAIVTRLNGERAALGKRPIGFLNPVLYRNPHVFNDITEGYNLGCNETAAFYAQEGWDPVTGLGTPNYPKLKELFLRLP